jgi:hypothetical protein
MRRFVEGIDRGQTTLFPECLEDWIDADNPVRVIGAFLSKRLGWPYRSGRSAHWVKVKNSKAPAVMREAEEDWGGNL